MLRRSIEVMSDAMEFPPTAKTGQDRKRNDSPPVRGRKKHDQN